MALLQARDSPPVPPPLPDPNSAYCQANNAPYILGITGAFTALAFLIVCLRMYARIAILHVVESDDYLAIAAMVTSLGVLVSFVGETTQGEVGYHFGCRSPEQMVTNSKWKFAHGYIPVFGVVFVKISVALFLLRLAQSSRKAWRWSLWGIIVFLACFAVACAGTLTFNCTPIAANWDFSLRENARCFSLDTFAAIGLFNSVINCATDLLLALLPIPVIVRLQTNLKTKITLASILCLGLVACVAGIVKAHYQSSFLRIPDPYWKDSFSIWFMLELNLGIIAASLPALKPLFSTFSTSVKTFFGFTSNQSTPHRARYAEPYVTFSHASEGRRRHYMDLMDPDGDVHLEEMKHPVTTISASTSSPRPGYGLKRGPLSGVSSRAMELSRSDGKEWDTSRSESQERLHQSSGIMMSTEIRSTSEPAER